MPPRGTQPPADRNKRPPAPHSFTTPWHNDQIDEHESETPWLMSYLDFMTVLVALFVLLYATEKARSAAERRAAVAETAAAAERAEAQAEPEPPIAEETAQSPPAAPPPTIADASLTSIPAPPDSTDIAASGFLEPQTLSPTEIFLAAQAATEAEIAAAAVAAAAAAMAEPVAEAPAVAAEAVLTPSPTEITDAAVTAEPGDVAAAVPAQPDALAALAPLADRITVKRDAQKLLIEIDDAILFRPASAVLTGDGRALLDKLRPVLVEHKGRITVEGHTDDRPIATARFPSNWELSAARASIVTRHLIGLGVAADRVVPVGRADTQSRADNATAEGRAQNRRVGIVLYTE